MIDFGATWCNPCHQLAHTFADRDVYRAIDDNFVPLAFDVSDDSAINDARKAKYDAGNLPAVRYLTADGKPLARIDHVVAPGEMMAILGGIKMHAGITSGPAVCSENQR